MVAKIFFWASFGIILYTYVGYPILLFVLVQLKKYLKRSIPHPLGVFQPPVTVVVTSFNEGAILHEKIINTLELDYPADKLKLMFVTDGSSDNSDTIVAAYPQICLLHEPERKGKLAAMNRAIHHIDTPITVFTDANTRLNADCLQKIVACYQDSRVGGVAGEKKILATSAQGVAHGESLYWKYESFLKRLDSGLHTTVGAAGELFSIRTHLYSVLPEHTIIEDFVQSLLLCQKGYVVRYEPAAFSVEKASVSIKDEMERKIRISAGAFQAMGMIKGLFNVFRYPATAFQLISHRILRWTLSPLALPVLFFSAFALYLQSGSSFFALIFWLQVLVYFTGLTGWLLASRGIRIKLFYIPFYFIFMHFCVFIGFYRYITKKQSVLWDKAIRQ